MELDGRLVDGGCGGEEAEGHAEGEAELGLQRDLEFPDDGDGEQGEEEVRGDVDGGVEDADVVEDGVGVAFCGAGGGWFVRGEFVLEGEEKGRDATHPVGGRRVKSQAASTGRHWKMMAIALPIVKAIRKTSVQMRKVRHLVRSARRRRKKPMLSFIEEYAMTIRIE